MKKALDLIDDTDRLLAEADENLRALKAMHDEMPGVESKFAKLQELVKKYEAVSLALQHEKLALLMVLVRTLLLINVRRIDCWRFDPKGVIKNQAGSESDPEFFCGSSEYHPFCRAALGVIVEYFRHTYIFQKNEREFLEGLLNELKTCATTKARVS
ncbi:MAG: hypothetical protein WC766_04735 [Patescibacteria group bacterium]|jgi:hypothetical protein